VGALVVWKERGAPPPPAEKNRAGGHRKKIGRPMGGGGGKGDVGSTKRGLQKNDSKQKTGRGRLKKRWVGRRLVASEE